MEKMSAPRRPDGVGAGAKESVERWDSKVAKRQPAVRCVDGKQPKEEGQEWLGH